MKLWERRSTWLAVGLALLLVSVARAAADSTGPTISNFSVTPLSTNTSAAPADVTLCWVATDDLSGIERVEVLFEGAKVYRHLPNVLFTCPRTTVSGLPTCNAGAAGLCFTATDCVSSDTCSAGGGSTVETVVCSGSAWQVKTTVANPTTTCVPVDALPRYAPGGDYTIYVRAIDRVGNVSEFTGAALGVASITNTP